MLNDQYEPRTEDEDRILSLLEDEGRLRPADIYTELGINRGSAQHYNDRLLAAGFIGRPKGGLYEFRFDPRMMSDEELAAVYIDHAIELTSPEHVQSQSQKRDVGQEA